MPTLSAGLLPYLVEEGTLHVWLAHMGGPFWARKDNASWTVVKGEYDPAEDPRHAAGREWLEEMGTPAPASATLLGEFRQSSHKTITVFSARVSNRSEVHFRSSNLIELEWPPRSGRVQLFPEIDRAEWFPLDTARSKILRGQLGVLDALESLLSS